jgi:hypothetical protein
MRRKSRELVREMDWNGINGIENEGIYTELNEK